MARGWLSFIHKRSTLKEEEPPKQLTDYEKKREERRKQGEILFKDQPPSDPKQLEEAFLIDYCIAHRIWEIELTGSREFALHSNMLSGKGGELWTPGKELEARCSPRSDKGKILLESHVAPSRLCRCGIFGHGNKEILSTWLACVSDTKIPIFHWAAGICGEVALWGRFVEGELGWRAQYGYPLKLYGMTCFGCGDSGEIKPFKQVNIFLLIDPKTDSGKQHPFSFCVCCLNGQTPDHLSFLANGLEAAHRLADRYGIEIVC